MALKLATIFTIPVVHQVVSQYPWAKELLIELGQHSPWTLEHSIRVSQIVSRLCDELQVPENEAAELVAGGMLHDIGKILIPSHVLNTTDPLKPKEISLLQRHPVLGSQIVAEHNQLIAQLIREHHDSPDDLAYTPQQEKQKETEFLPFLRFISLADKVDALSSSRPYKPGWPREKVIEALASRYGELFIELALDEWEEIEQNK